MRNKIFQIAVFGCLGITVEIFFTAIMNNIGLYRDSESLDLALRGHSYIWMFPIYGSAAILFPPVIPLISNLNVLLRIAIYGLGIFGVEFLTGWLLDVFTGSCPWEYTSGYHVMGYIQLEYYPLWCLFGLMVERIYLLISKFEV